MRVIVVVGTALFVILPGVAVLAQGSSTFPTTKKHFKTIETAPGQTYPPAPNHDNGIVLIGIQIARQNKLRRDEQICLCSGVNSKAAWRCNTVL
jgi:hypothetical protein